ncbi:MAG: hypothetical protein A3J76_03570 [Candidatus Moranbacteria bacterium RBG_13_45_13]|nr:MAG: hypothetical protein A3J76_03570 [Candidatus Moranbacteria bacterium RBG_13_45_13]
MEKHGYEAYKKISPPKEPDTPEEIYRFLASKFHPDKKGVEEYMIELNEAREQALEGRPEKLQELYKEYRSARANTFA